MYKHSNEEEIIQFINKLAVFLNLYDENQYIYIALDVTDRTIARYISELKDKDIIERKGPDNGGECKIK